MAYSQGPAYGLSIRAASCLGFHLFNVSVVDHNNNFFRRFRSLTLNGNNDYEPGETEVGGLLASDMITRYVNGRHMAKTLVRLRCPRFSGTEMRVSMCVQMRERCPMNGMHMCLPQELYI